jgi:hypothetical protein
MKRGALIGLSVGFLIVLWMVDAGLQPYFHPEIAVAAERHEQNHVANERRRRHEAQQHQAAHEANERRRIAFEHAHPEVVAARKAEERREQFVAQQAAAAKERADAAAAAEHERSQAAEAAYSAAHIMSIENCSKANDIENEASSAGDQRGYDLSVQGLAVNEYCSDTDRLINKGYFLSIKGLDEHALSSGDSRTDLNEANQLLVECQTTPGVYGTHRAASCETQEE